jgi:hypothetical protein
MAGFHGLSKTPFHSKIHGLVLPKVVIILPCHPSHSKTPFYASMTEPQALRLNPLSRTSPYLLSPQRSRSSCKRHGNRTRMRSA